MKIPESLLNQKVEFNHQVEVYDHIHSQVQFQERDNLPKRQCDFQNNFNSSQRGFTSPESNFQPTYPPYPPCPQYFQDSYSVPPVQK